ncbi:LPXTG cell wall anchor domain-containing protein [Sellimonas caecigallum]|uniref:LPXTG cell wall anchor domain-containing protein n=1 Tax=Sellimonas caecigallum TaxID=2592333 RepID=A0ABS7L3T2_9FIRM|nr:LPXTG cell wall anchor domain-containing protein [Sellimonas caecigallum]MBY0757694.1 LPXTG cell wall anchor domain-containing protein [Sellimonas caecigallum]
MTERAGKMAIIAGIAAVVGAAAVIIKKRK